MKKLLLIVTLFYSAAVFADGKITVVRAHPYLTRGLEKESLIGMYFETPNDAASMGLFQLRLRFVNCSPNDVSNIQVWKMPADRAYAFNADDALELIAGSVEEQVTADTLTVAYRNFPSNTIKTKRNFNDTSDYVWITAKINPDISEDAEIYSEITSKAFSVGGWSQVENGETTHPHRVFPYYYKSGAYFRQDKVSGTRCAPLEDATEARLQSLNDIILINDLEPVYDAATDSFTTTWDKRKNNDGSSRDNTAGVKYVQGLRDKYHKNAMVRIGLTKNDTKMTMNGETAHPLAFAVSTPTYRAQLIAEIVRIMEETGVDGLDVDWEYPGVNSGSLTDATTWNRDWHNYGLFLRDLAAEFFDHGWVLSMCTNLGWTMPSDTETPKLQTTEANREKFKSVLHVPDYIDSMAYGQNDHKDRNGNVDYLRPHASPQVMKDAIKAINDCGVPNRRIVVGQAIYAFEVQNPVWSTVVNWLVEAHPDNLIRRWDADLIWKERSVTRADGSIISTTKETFEGPSSYHAKIAWCRENDMGGAMSWGYYSDVAWKGEDLMSLGRHHAKSLPMIANLPTAPNKDGDVYLIETEQDWNWLAANTNVTTKLTKDITFTYDPLMITDWLGTLDGQGHTITIPEDIWIAREGAAGLFGTIRNGIVKNLKVCLKGRVLTRASRWNDIKVGKGLEDSTCPSDVYVGVLAAEVRASSTIENVTININEGAEVQGVYRTGGLAGNVYAPNTANLVITNCMVSAKGTVHNLNINSSETVIDLSAGAEVSSLVGHVQRPPNVSAPTIYISNAFVINPDNSVSILNSSDKLVSASSNQIETYILNGHDQADFKLSITIDDEGKPVVAAPEGFNGTIKILGAADLNGPWSENNSGAKFFKAELGL